MKNRPWMMFRWIIIIFGINVQVLWGAEPSSFHFLSTHVGARPSALAGAVVAHRGDIHGIYFNPAGLGAISQQVASATYLKHVLDFQSGFLGYAHPIRKRGVIAGAINYIDYGQFEERDESGQQIGTFNANTIVITGTYATQLMDSLLIGVSGKYIRSVIQAFTADAIAADVGLVYAVPYIDDLTVGVAVLNTGQALSAFVDDKERLPQKIIAGFSKKLAHLPLLLNVNGYKVSGDDDIQFAVGGEFNIAPGVNLRLGYDSIGRDQLVNSDLDRLAGISVGFGFARNEYQLDYAFSSMGQVGSLNRVTFTYRF